MDYLVSVIIPTYNAENFIEDTINNIRNQTIGFENIELILVDDHSSDSTKNIIEKNSQKFNNIKSYSTETNSGTPSRGRNIGIERAQSDFVMFLDQDDKYHSRMCEILYNTIIETDTDFVMCNHRLIHENETIEENADLDSSFYICNPKEDMKIFSQNHIWEKIYKKSFLEKFDIKFPEGYFMEDVYFSMKSYLNTDKIAYLENYYGYEYNIRDSDGDLSESHKITKNWYYKSIKTFFFICEFFHEANRQDLLNILMKDEFVILVGWFCRLNEDKKTKLYFLNEFHDLIEYSRFDDKLDEVWANIIFENIKKKNFNIVLILSKFINILFNSYKLRKLYRKIYNKQQ